MAAAITARLAPSSGRSSSIDGNRLCQRRRIAVRHAASAAGPPRSLHRSRCRRTPRPACRTATLRAAPVRIFRRATGRRATSAAASASRRSTPGSRPGADDARSAARPRTSASAAVRPPCRCRRSTRRRLRRSSCAKARMRSSTPLRGVSLPRNSTIGPLPTQRAPGTDAPAVGAVEFMSTSIGFGISGIARLR